MPMWCTYCLRGSSGSMWVRGRIWLQTSLFIFHRYSIKQTHDSAGFYSFSRYMTNTWCLHAGAAEVPARLSQLYQRGHDQPGWAALQNRSRLRQVAVCHDPQNAEGAGSCWWDKKHVPWRVEEGKGRTVQRQNSHLRKWRGETRRDEASAWPLLFSLLLLPLAAHHLLLQQAEWHDSAGGQNRLPENHFKLANIWLCLLCC